MVFHKIQKGLAIAVATSMVATSVPAGDYRAVLAATKQEELKQKQTVTLADSNEISENDEGVFKVTMDDTGYLTADNEYAANENTPFSWDNVNMYFVITDRFYNGDPNNDHSYGRSATSSAQVSAVNDIENKEDPAAAFERIAAFIISLGCATASLIAPIDAKWTLIGVISALKFTTPTTSLSNSLIISESFSTTFSGDVNGSSERSGASFTSLILTWSTLKASSRDSSILFTCLFKCRRNILF